MHPQLSRVAHVRPLRSHRWIVRGLVILLFSTISFAQERFEDIEFVRSKTAQEKDVPRSITGSVTVDTQHKFMEFLDDKGARILHIPLEKVTSLQNVRREVPPTLIHFHAAKHFFRIRYADADGGKRSIELSQNKREAWYVMLELQATTGRKVEDKSECCVRP